MRYGRVRSQRRVYLVIAIAGLIIPNVAFVPWVLDHGVDVTLFLDELFATRVSTFFALDVVISVVAIWAFVLAEGHRPVHARWAPILGTVLVGASFGIATLSVPARDKQRGRRGRAKRRMMLPSMRM